jgi:hypothetical protein
VILLELIFLSNVFDISFKSLVYYNLFDAYVYQWLMLKHVYLLFTMHVSIYSLLPIFVFGLSIDLHHFGIIL